MATRTRSVGSVLLAFAVAVAVLYFLLQYVGVAAVLRALLDADRVLIALSLLVTVLWVVVWSYPMWLVFSLLDVRASRTRTLVVFLVTMFVNNVAPFSVGGGEPIAAAMVSRSTRADFKTAFLAVVSTDVLNFLPAPVFAVVGLLYVVTTSTLGRQLEVVLASLLVIGALVAAASWLAWEHRRWLEWRLLQVLGLLQRVVARIAPGVGDHEPETVAAGFGTFLDGLERVATDRRTLALGLAASALGWVLHAGVLWLALEAVGVDAPLAATVFVVTLVVVTDVVPVPGGLGTVDAVLVGVLVTVLTIDAASATAATLIYRGLTLVLPIVAGGVVAVALELRPSTVGE